MRPRRCQASPSRVRGVVAAVRRYRAIPYVTADTVMDFTGSPRYAHVAKQMQEQQQQYQQAVQAARKHAAATAARAAAARAASSNGSDMAQRQRPPPSSSAAARDAATTAAHAKQRVYANTAAMDMMPPLSDGYQRDLRVDSSYAHLPESVLAAKQSMLTMQEDSFGPVMRGVVPPPAPLSPEEYEAVVASAYTQPRVELDETWWCLVAAFALVFVLLALYGH